MKKLFNFDNIGEKFYHGIENNFIICIERMSKKFVCIYFLDTDYNVSDIPQGFGIYSDNIFENKIYIPDKNKYYIPKKDSFCITYDDKVVLDIGPSNSWTITIH
jgi:hypothetical protein